MQSFNAFFFGRLGLLAIVGTLFAIHAPGCSAEDQSVAAPAARDGAFAVVELFTSEGCSSCPPADALLGEVAADAQRRGVAIYPIAFHIDYWDGLGWRDRFSLHDATDRQQRYAMVLGSENYTPQMIVNGRAQFVGSDRGAYLRAVSAALNSPSLSHLTLELRKIAGADQTIRYAATNAPAGSVLNLVIVQRFASTDVPRGENAGATLHHVNIARSIKTIPLDSGNGEVTVKLPDGLDAKDAMVIGYVQNPDTLQIVAAAQLNVGSATK